MLNDHDGRAVREQAVEASEQGLHVEPKQTARIAENSRPAGHFRVVAGGWIRTIEGEADGLQTCPVPKLIRGLSDLAFRARYAALRYSLISPPTTLLRSIGR